MKRDEAPQISNKSSTVNNTVINKVEIAPELITEILNNPNTESISLNYDRVGDRENLRIDVKERKR